MSEPTMYHYIKEDSEYGIVIVSSETELTLTEKHIQVNSEEIAAMDLQIQYSDCCHIDDSGNLSHDPVKCIAKRLEKVKLDVEQKTRQLRSLLTEASAMDKKDVVTEIAAMIKKLNDFLKKDFSSVTDLTQIDTLTCAELNMDLHTYYANKIYGI